MSFSASSDKKPKIAHFVNPWLPLTQAWIYNEIIHNSHCAAMILCRYTERSDLFAVDNVYPAYARYGLWAALNMIVARARARYPAQPYLSIVQREKPDILHGHFSHESWRNIHIAQKTGIPLVTTFYGLDVDKLSRRAAWKRRYPVLFDTGSLFFVEGPHMAGRLEAIGCPKRKIQTVYQGADIQRIRRHTGQKDRSAVNILFIGLARLKKGAEYAAHAFVEAAQHDCRAHLHLVGDGVYRKKTTHILARAGMLQRATFHGYIDTDTYLSLLGQSDILLAPSITDANGDTEGGAPVSVIEALVAGVPVVGTNHCDIPHVVAHGETGLLCNERDAETLSKNLAALVQNEKLRKEMGQRAFETSPGRHDIRVRVDAITEHYRTVLS
jgi:colanic acid/amylovoran biosynthesis glycosyltransferase